MLIEATPFAKSSSNGDNGSGWSIKRLAYPENVLSLLHVLSCPRGASSVEMMTLRLVPSFDGAKLL